MGTCSGKQKAISQNVVKAETNENDSNQNVINEDEMKRQEEEQIIKQIINKLEIKKFKINVTKTKFKEPNQKRKNRNNLVHTNAVGKPIEKERQSRNFHRNNQFKERQDKRKRVAKNKSHDNTILDELSEWPYCSIGIVQFKDNKEDKFGTGTLIGTNEVLTAAHNVYNDDKQYMTEIFFMVGYDEKTYEKKVEILKIYIPDDYMNDPKNSIEDYAVLILKESLEDYGYFGVSSVSFQDLENKELSLFGYLANNQELHHEMWGCSGKLEKKRDSLDENNFLLVYKDIMTGPGQSGSGLFFKENEGFYICGVHNFQYPGCESVGVHITQERLININIWTGLTNDHIELNLSKCGITSEGIKHLKKVKSNLTHLNLSWNNKISNRGLKYLRECFFPNLIQLNLSYNNITHEGIKHLSDFSFPNLIELDLSGNQIRLEGTKELTKCKFPNLTHLFLSGIHLNDEAIDLLKDCNFPNLTRLDLSWNNRLTSKGIDYLRQFNFKYLTILDLFNNKITDEGMFKLRNCFFQNLTKLDLYNNNITDEGIKHLSECSLENLNELNLRNNKITVGVIKYLERCSFKNLTLLDLSCNNITDKEETRSNIRIIFKKLRDLTL